MDKEDSVLFELRRELKEQGITLADLVAGLKAMRQGPLTLEVVNECNGAAHVYDHIERDSSLKYDAMYGEINITVKKGSVHSYSISHNIKLYPNEDEDELSRPKRNRNHRERRSAQ